MSRASRHVEAWYERKRPIATRSTSVAIGVRSVHSFTLDVWRSVRCVRVRLARNRSRRAPHARTSRTRLAATLNRGRRTAQPVALRRRRSARAAPPRSAKPWKLAAHSLTHDARSTQPRDRRGRRCRRRRSEDARGTRPHAREARRGAGRARARRSAAWARRSPSSRRRSACSRSRARRWSRCPAISSRSVPRPPRSRRSPRRATPVVDGRLVRWIELPDATIGTVPRRRQRVAARRRRRRLRLASRRRARALPASSPRRPGLRIAALAEAPREPADRAASSSSRVGPRSTSCSTARPNRHRPRRRPAAATARASRCRPAPPTRRRACPRPARRRPGCCRARQHAGRGSRSSTKRQGDGWRAYRRLPLGENPSPTDVSPSHKSRGNIIVVSSTPAPKYVCPRCRSSFEDPCHFCRECGADMTRASALDAARIEPTRRATDGNDVVSRSPAQRFESSVARQDRRRSLQGDGGDRARRHGRRVSRRAPAHGQGRRDEGVASRSRERPRRRPALRARSRGGLEAAPSRTPCRSSTSGRRKARCT